MTLSLISTAKFALKFGTLAIQRWTDYRRDQFFQCLLENLQIEQASKKRRSEVDEMLDQLLASDESSEVLFDAYRKVCFARSKNYGPRIIGLLTAELLNDSRNSDEEDDMIFEAAERLSDVQLVEFKRHYESLSTRLKEKADSDGDVIKRGEEFWEICDQFTHETGRTDTHQRMLPLDLREIYGGWAALLEDCGLLIRTTHQKAKSISEDSERNIYEDSTWITTSTTLIFTQSSGRLYQLLLRARKERVEKS